MCRGDSTRFNQSSYQARCHYLEIVNIGLGRLSHVQGYVSGCNGGTLTLHSPRIGLTYRLLNHMMIYDMDGRPCIATSHSQHEMFVLELN